LLTESQFVSWCERLKLSKEAEAAVRLIRSSPPARRVGGGRHNVSGCYPSRKMGHTIQFESHTVELPLVYQMEHEDDVLAYYCQPPPIELEYLSPSGRRVVAWHTADYFVIRSDSAGWVEAKSHEDLPTLSQKSPNRYQLTGNRWECPPGRAYAAPLGLTYELHSSDDISKVFVRNALFLDDYLRASEPVPDTSIDTVRRCLAKNPAIMLEELFFQTKDLVPSDDIYRMIVDSAIHVDWNATPLKYPERVRVFSSREAATQFSRAANHDRPDIGLVSISPGATLFWDGRPWGVVNVGHNNVALLGENKTLTELPLDVIESLLREGRLISSGDSQESAEHSEVTERLRNASADDLEVANKRMVPVLAYLQRKPGDMSTSPNRTVRMHISRYKRAKEAYGNGYIGLIPQLGKSGNRRSKISEPTRIAMIKSIEKEYETLEQRTRFSCWASLKQCCEETDLDYPSYATYCTAIKTMSRHTQTLKRQGARSAYKYETFYWTLDEKTPRHGDRPFEIAHIDHTQLDVTLICSQTGMKLGRPWLTILTDAYSRRILAIYLTFDEPSYRSCMMVLRECVRRHGRLPQTIVMDGGPEFKSTYFETVLAWFECTKKTRPPAKARFGSVCERLFGTTNTQFVHNLRGNTQIMKNVRQVTKSNNPENLALWNFAALDARLDNYLFDVYDILEHPSLAQSPRDAFVSGLNATGIRSHKYIAYDTDFLMMTSPTTFRGSAKVFPGQGVTINYFSYWSESFRDPSIENQLVLVRYDPFDISIAWAFVRGRWVECHSQYYAQMKGLTEKQVKLATTILRQKKHLSSGVRVTVTAKAIADFLTHVHKDEAVLLQQVRDRQSKVAREQFGLHSSHEHQGTGKILEAERTAGRNANNQLHKFEVYGAL
jgi:putative transposase